MWKIISIAEFQHDLDVGWVEYCDARIKHLRLLSLNVKMEHSKIFLEKSIAHFKVMRRMK